MTSDARRAEVSDRSRHVGPVEPATLDGWAITIDGLVARPEALEVADLARLGTTGGFRSGVTCPDGVIGISGADYEGIALEDVIARAEPLPGAEYVLIHSGGYVAGFKLDSIGRRQGVLAFRRNGEELTWQQGGPVRLVVAQGACFDTVKWVERVELAPDNSKATVLDIVRARRAAHLAK